MTGIRPNKEPLRLKKYISRIEQWVLPIEVAQAVRISEGSRKRRRVGELLELNGDDDKLAGEEIIGIST